MSSQNVSLVILLRANKFLTNFTLNFLLFMFNQNVKFQIKFNSKFVPAIKTFYSLLLVDLVIMNLQQIFRVESFLTVGNFTGEFFRAVGFIM